MSIRLLTWLHIKRASARPNYCIKISPMYMEKILKSFRGKGSAEFFRQHTDELWDPYFSRLSAAEYGAFRRILAMFARSKRAFSR